MDEIFGRDNFIANVIWEKKYSPQNNSTFFQIIMITYLYMVKTKILLNLMV